MAQKFTSKGCCRSLVIKVLSASVSIAETTGSGLGGCAARPFFDFWAGAAKLNNAMHSATGRIVFEKRIFLPAFDSAAKSFGFGLLDWLVVQRSVECVAQIVCFDLGGVPRVVDAPVIKELVVLVNKVSFGRN